MDTTPRNLIYFRVPQEFTDRLIQVCTWAMQSRDFHMFNPLDQYGNDMTTYASGFCNQILANSLGGRNSFDGLDPNMTWDIDLAMQDDVDVLLTAIPYSLRTSCNQVDRVRFMESSSELEVVYCGKNIPVGTRVMIRVDRVSEQLASSVRYLKETGAFPKVLDVNSFARTYVLSLLADMVAAGLHGELGIGSISRTREFVNLRLSMVAVGYGEDTRVDYLASMADVGWSGTHSSAPCGHSQGIYIHYKEYDKVLEQLESGIAESVRVDTHLKTNFPCVVAFVEYIRNLFTDNHFDFWTSEALGENVLLTYSGDYRIVEWELNRDRDRYTCGTYTTEELNGGNR